MKYFYEKIFANQEVKMRNQFSDRTLAPPMTEVVLTKNL